jgi:hypothetical protein
MEETMRETLALLLLSVFIAPNIAEAQSPIHSQDTYQFKEGSSTAKRFARQNQPRSHLVQPLYAAMVATASFVAIIELAHITAASKNGQRNS